MERLNEASLRLTLSNVKFQLLESCSTVKGLKGSNFDIQKPKLLWLEVVALKIIYLTKKFIFFQNRSCCFSYRHVMRLLHFLLKVIKYLKTLTLPPLKGLIEGFCYENISSKTVFLVLCLQSSLVNFKLSSCRGSFLASGWWWSCSWWYAAADGDAAAAGVVAVVVRWSHTLTYTVLKASNQPFWIRQSEKD